MAEVKGELEPGRTASGLAATKFSTICLVLWFNPLGIMYKFLGYSRFKPLKSFRVAGSYSTVDLPIIWSTSKNPCFFQASKMPYFANFSTGTLSNCAVLGLNVISTICFNWGFLLINFTSSSVDIALKLLFNAVLSL